MHWIIMVVVVKGKETETELHANRKCGHPLLTQLLFFGRPIAYYTYTFSFSCKLCLLTLSLSRPNKWKKEANIGINTSMLYEQQFTFHLNRWQLISLLWSNNTKIYLDIAITLIGLFKHISFFQNCKRI